MPHACAAFIEVVMSIERQMQLDGPATTTPASTPWLSHTTARPLRDNLSRMSCVRVAHMKLSGLTAAMMCRDAGVWYPCWTLLIITEASAPKIAAMGTSALQHVRSLVVLTSCCCNAWTHVFANRTDGTTGLAVGTDYNPSCSQPQSDCSILKQARLCSQTMLH